MCGQAATEFLCLLNLSFSSISSSFSLHSLDFSSYLLILLTSLLSYLRRTGAAAGPEQAGHGALGTGGARRTSAQEGAGGARWERAAHGSPDAGGRGQRAVGGRCAVRVAAVVAAAAARAAVAAAAWGLALAVPVRRPLPLLPTTTGSHFPQPMCTDQISRSQPVGIGVDILERWYRD
ncbi:unnamed protein product [Urochloa humidicola]